MRHATFRQLEVFEAIARLGSFTRAARELFLTQPTVSMQIRKLTEAAGLPLFEQVGKRTHLTDAGREVYRYARLIAGELNELEGALARLKGVAGGRLRISVASTANYFMPGLLAAFYQRHPGVTVSLDVTNRETLLRQLGDNSVDLVVMGQPPADLDVEASSFMENPLVIVAPPAHVLARARRIPLERLQEETFVVREHGSGTRIAMERFFAERGITLHTGMEVGSNEAIKQSVQAGLGLGLLSQDTLEQELTLKRLVILNVAEFPIRRHWYVVHRRGKRLSPAAESFQRFLTEEAPGMLGSRGQAVAPGRRKNQRP
jgi:DNA-binding transcriptional LysR family regulator